MSFVLACSKWMCFTMSRIEMFSVMKWNVEMFDRVCVNFTSQKFGTRKKMFHQKAFQWQCKFFPHQIRTIVRCFDNDIFIKDKSEISIKMVGFWYTFSVDCHFAKLILQQKHWSFSSSFVEYFDRFFLMSHWLSLLNFYFKSPSSFFLSLFLSLESINCVKLIVFRRQIVSERRIFHHEFIVLVEASVVLANAAAAAIATMVVFTMWRWVTVRLLHVRMLYDFVCGFLMTFWCNQFLETDDCADNQCNFTDDCKIDKKSMNYFFGSFDERRVSLKLATFYRECMCLMER